MSVRPDGIVRVSGPKAYADELQTDEGREDGVRSVLNQSASSP